MKRLLFISFVVFSGMCFAQNTVQDQLEKNDFNFILNHLSESVEVEIDHNKNIYSSKQGKLVLSSFFTENGMADFRTLHNGTSKSDEQFLIGTFKGKNRSYKLNIKYISKDETLIQFISIN